HLRHAYVQTAHAAQGQTAERVLIHADSRSANLVDQKMLYVALSRARSETIVVTDDKARLIRAIHERAGEKQTAMEVSAPEAAKTKSLGAGLG
ncbi:MAG: exonuclease V subunit alpha, partial [Erythrobacter sp.]|nr:exonuclease V subunit alpha [Erythrobacter sp.]